MALRKSIAALTLAFMIVLVGTAHAQGTATASQTFNATLTLQQPASCSIGTISDLAFGNQFIPPSGTSTATAQTQATVTYSNANDVTGSLSPNSFAWDNGNVNVSLSLSRGSFTPGSGTVTFAIDGTATISSSANPGNYTQTVTLNVTCTP